MAVGRLARLFLKRRRGLLLAELLITIAIAGLAAALLLPQIHAWHQERLLTATTEEICALIRTTQAQARTRSRLRIGYPTRELRFTNVDGRIRYGTYLGTTATTPSGYLPEGIVLNSPYIELSFNVNGFPKSEKNYTITVMPTDKSHARRITIARYTGRIRVEDVW